MNKTYNNDIEISFFDLCKYVLCKWKSILIVCLVCLILAGGYCYYLSKQEIQESNNMVASLVSTLTKEEQKEVEDAAERVNELRKLYNMQKEYNDNSILQHLNPYAINTEELSFYVDNYYKVSYPDVLKKDNIVPIVQSYVSLLSGDEFYEQLAKEFESSIDPAYYQEMIDINVEKMEEGMFVVTISFDSEEKMTNIGDYIKDRIFSQKDNITDKYGNHNITLASETKKVIISNDVTSLQQHNIQILTDIKKSISDEEKAFSGDQYNYLKYLIHETPEMKTNVTKYCVVSVLISLVLMVAYYVIKYVFSDTVKTEKEFERLFDVDSLGRIEDLNVIVAKIDTLSNKRDYKRVAIVTDNAPIDLVEQIVNNTKVDTLIIKNILKSSESYVSISSVDAVVFVEKEKVSKRNEVYSKLAVCKDLGVDILGFISV